QSGDEYPDGTTHAEKLPRNGPGGRRRERGIMTEAGAMVKGSGGGGRPRERLRALGPAALGDAEVLGVVVGSGTPGRSAMAVGRLLARRRPGELAEWPAARWMQMPGVGAARAAALVAAFELGRRAAKTPLPGGPIRGPEDVL